MEGIERMPLLAGVPLAAATLQVIADDAGVDLLHIKGAAVDEVLLQRRLETDSVTGETLTVVIPRASLDADVLVRPSHVQRFFSAMEQHRWTMVYRFEDGSAFEHASTWIRPGVCHADIHRAFPGIGVANEQAFDALWQDRRAVELAGQGCPVPSVPAQRLLLLLHAVRGGALHSPDIVRAWGEASGAERDEVSALATRLRAEVALAAATGRLDDHRSAREYRLWKALSSGATSRTTLWLARVAAEPTPVQAMRTAVRLIAPKQGRLKRSLGHAPGPLEVSRAWAHQLGLVAQEVVRIARAAVNR